MNIYFIGGYNVPADIQANAMGRDNLYYDTHKFYLHTNGLVVKRWCCNKRILQKCKAVINTMQVDGETMMKIIDENHTHEP